MQMERLMGILFRLLDQRRVTAEQLARQFGVSVRTIRRDIDTLSLSGIPLYTARGRNGGISLMEGFVMDRSFFTGEEQRELLSALRETALLRSAGAALPEGEELLQKLRGLFRRQGTAGEDWLEIRYADWSGARGDLFPELKQAIFSRRLISFLYYNSRGEKGKRLVEPMKLIFKYQAWYLYGYCREKEDFRLFKLMRMRELEITQAHFSMRALPPWGAFGEGRDPSEAMSPEGGASPGEVAMTLRIQERMGYRMYDEFLEEQWTKEADGSYLVQVAFPPGEWIFSFLGSFGPDLEVLSPQWLREEVRRRLEKTLARYRSGVGWTGDFEKFSKD